MSRDDLLRAILAGLLALPGAALAQIPESSAASEAEVAAAAAAPGADDGGGRIIGGEDVRPGELPFQVQVMQTDNGTKWSDEHRCGGALITPEWVLTAAHCFFNRNNSVPFKAEVFAVRVGIVDISRAPATAMKVLRANGLYIHPGYVSEVKGPHWSRAPGFPLSEDHKLWFTHDVALIRLAAPVPASALVRPIERYRSALPAGQEVYGSGWGLTANQTDARVFSWSPTLKVVELSAVPCRGATLPTHVCAGGRPGKDSCKGDSGGPLFLYPDPRRPGVPALAGITSRRIFGAECAGERPETRYSRVDGDNGAWIDRVLAADGKRW
jgi:hypothetical protein